MHITLFKSITMLCGTDKFPHNVSGIILTFSLDLPKRTL